jgi:hypothetical protein
MKGIASPGQTIGNVAGLGEPGKPGAGRAKLRLSRGFPGDLRPPAGTPQSHRPRNATRDSRKTARQEIRD